MSKHRRPGTHEERPAVGTYPFAAVAALVIEQKFLGVHQRPDNVLVGDLLFLFVLLDVGQRDLEFIVLRSTRVNGQIQLLDLLFVRLLGVLG